MEIGFGVSLYSARRSRGQALLRSFNAATSVNPSTALITLPAYLAISSTGVPRTVQTSAETIKSSIGTNASRARNVGGGWALSVDAALAGNYMLRSSEFDNVAWAKEAGTTVTANQVVGPEGLLSADLIDFTATAVGSGIYQNNVALASVPFATRSVWLRSVAGSVTVDLNNASDTQANATYVLSTTWQRCEHVGPALAGGAGLWIRKNAGNQIYASYAQAEIGAYPSGAMLSVGSANAHGADILSVPVPANVAPGGFFDQRFVFAPHYASTESEAEHDIFFLGAGNRGYFSNADRKVYFHFGGLADLSSGALTFAREVVLDVRLTYRASHRRLSVRNAATGATLYDSGPQAAGSAISLPATAYLMGNASGSQECASLFAHAVYAP